MKLASFFAVVFVALAAASDPVRAGGSAPSFFQLQPVLDTGLCLYPINGLTAKAGDEVILIDCGSGGAATNWYRDGSRLHWFAGNLCADVGLSVVNGDPIFMNDCNLNDVQAPGQVWLTDPPSTAGRPWMVFSGVAWCLTATGLTNEQVVASAGVIAMRCNLISSSQRWIGGT